MKNRREFLRDAVTIGASGAGVILSSNANVSVMAGEPARKRRKRVFVAGFAHETNTFHPVRTTAFSFSTYWPLT